MFFITEFVITEFHCIFLTFTTFQCRLFLRITTLLTWPMSTLLLKNKCFGKTIYMKTQYLLTNETQHYWKGKCLRSDRWSRERVALIKSLIYTRWKETRLRHCCQIELNLSADTHSRNFNHSSSFLNTQNSKLIFKELAVTMKQV